MSEEMRVLRFMNETGHVQGLRSRLRQGLPAREAVECERMLDEIIRWTVHYTQPAPPSPPERTP